MQHRWVILGFWLFSRFFAGAADPLCPATASAQLAADPSVKRLPSIWSLPTSVTGLAEPDQNRDLTVVLENEQVRLGFQSGEKGFGLGSMIFLKNGREALSQVDVRAKWWQVDVRDAEGNVTSVQNRDAPAGKFSAFDDASTGGQFVWEQVPVPGIAGSITVTVTARLTPGSSLARFRISIKNRLKDASVWDVHFPHLNHLGYPGQSDVLVPSTHSMMVHGELHRAATGRLYASYLGARYVDYPGGGFPIGHMSASIGGETVVYIGCHDPHGNTKGYGWEIEEGLRFHVPPPDASLPGHDYEPDWDFVIGPMRGDWYDAARVYREWATRQFWCAKGRLSDRHDQPASFLEIPWWGDPQWPATGYRDQVFPADAKADQVDRQFRPPVFDPQARAYDVQRDEMLRRNSAAIEAYGLPLGIQWYGWHKARFDGNYPQYFPARPGFAETLRQQARPGLSVHGFLNGLWFDRSLPEFTAAARWEVQDLATFQKAAHLPLDPLKAREGTALMCPHCEYWQKSLAKLAEQMNETGFQGAYLDVLANAGGQMCFDPDHGHPTGGGNWFAVGSRKAVDGMKGPGKLSYVTSECFSEPLGQSIDLFYQWNDWKADEAPLLDTVYSGYLQWYGTGNGGGIDAAARLTRTIFWGGRISIYASADLAPGNEGLQYLIARLVALQRRAHKYLTYGEMVRPPDEVGTKSWRLVSPATNDRPGVSVETVERAAWKAADGSIGLCLANYDARPLTVKFDLRSMPSLAAEKPTVLAPSATEPIDVSSDGQILHITLPPGIPLLVEIGRWLAETSQ